MTDCIFCQIINGDIPSFKLYENEHILAILDIEPLSKGHALIIPKQHAAKLHEIPDETLQHILPVTKKLAVAMELEDYNLLQNNGELAHQAVMHAHFHLIPKYSQNDGLQYNFKHLTMNMSELSNVAKDIAAKINNL